MKKASRFTVQKGWKILIADMGINPVDVLSLAGLPGDLFSRKEASLSIEEYFQLWEGLEKAGADLELPLAMSKALTVEAFDAPIFASLCSPNLNVALQRLSHYKRLIGPMTLEVEITDKGTRATIECYGYKNPLPRSLGVVEMVFLTQLARMATRERIRPLRVTFTRPPEDRQAYEEFFGAGFKKGNSNSIIFSAEDALRPFLTDNPAMWEFFEPGLKKKLSDLDEEATTEARVKSALLEMLPSGQSSIEEMAKRLAISKRSLQRRLNSEASSYQQVLNSTRQELAQHYLSNSNLSPGEISFLLGFQDSNSFIRAFGNWTGTTPGQFRNAH